LITHADVVFLAHYTGGGIDGVLDLEADEFFEYLESAVEFQKLEMQRPVRVVLAGIEKRS